MRLYTPGLPTDYARHVIDQGFVGLPRAVYGAEELDAATRDTPEGEIAPPKKLPEPTDVVEYCEFRDMPPGGLASSRTTEAEIEQTGETEFKMTIDGGPSLLDDPGGFVLSIEVPDSVALANEIHDERPWDRPFREFWLTPEEANRYRDTLEIIDTNDGEEVQPDLRGWHDVPSQAPVPAVHQAEDDTADLPPSTRRSRRLRRRSRKKGRRMEGNDEARPGTNDEAAASVNTVLPQRFEDDPEGALNDLRAKVNELGYQLAYAGRTFKAPVTKRTYYIIDPEKREPIDALRNGAVDLTLLEVCLWSEQAFKK
jgi:hypothetical protein